MKVAYIYPYAFQYRREFHEFLRSKLALMGVEYQFIYSKNPHFPDRGDFIPPEWAISVPCTYLKLGGAEIRYQHALMKAFGLDLAIVQQENGLAMNYPLQVLGPLLGTKVAFFGHGRNFQSTNIGGLKEKFKRFWIDKVDWWFAYTERSADIVATAGFPRERITVFNNAIDTSTIRSELASISETDRAALRARFGGSENIGVYIGGLYHHKRIPFLIEAAKAVRRLVPDFQLLVVGGGIDGPIVQAAAAEHHWIHALGPKFGREKTLIASLGRVFLMPGLVGLGVLDSFAYGAPMVTTELSYHSPEIDYLKDGVNGVLVAESDSVEAYASAVARVLTDADWRAMLRAGGEEALETYTVENMADRFAEGVMRALGRA